MSEGANYRPRSGMDLPPIHARRDGDEYVILAMDRYGLISEVRVPADRFDSLMERCDDAS